jgi:hypothetical protein
MKITVFWDGHHVAWYQDTSCRIHGIPFQKTNHHVQCVRTWSLTYKYLILPLKNICYEQKYVHCVLSIAIVNIAVFWDVMPYFW